MLRQSTCHICHRHRGFVLSLSLHTRITALAFMSGPLISLSTCSSPCSCWRLLSLMSLSFWITHLRPNLQWLPYIPSSNSLDSLSGSSAALPGVPSVPVPQAHLLTFSHHFRMLPLIFFSQAHKILHILHKGSFASPPLTEPPLLLDFFLHESFFYCSHLCSWHVSLGAEQCYSVNFWACWKKGRREGKIRWKTLRFPVIFLLQLRKEKNKDNYIWNDCILPVSVSEHVHLQG